MSFIGRLNKTTQRLCLEHRLDTSTTKSYLHPTTQLYHEILILTIILPAPKSSRESGDARRGFDKVRILCKLRQPCSNIFRALHFGLHAQDNFARAHPSTLYIADVF